MLEVEKIQTYYGESHILQGVSLKVEAGTCVALLGSNGMGKTTTLRTIMGLTPARKGTVRFKGQDVTTWTPFNIARLGLGYVPEDRGIFGDLTVIENLKIPYLNLSSKDRKSWKEIEADTFTLFPSLSDHASQLAGSLSGGEQQMLTTARALIMGREMVLLDEPTEGLSPLLVQNLTSAFQEIKKRGITILLVEQNIHTATQLADYCYVLEKGHIKLEESMDVLKQNPELLKQYLGIN